MHLFDPKKLKTLDNPQRLEEIPLEKLVQALNLSPGNHLADVGCGAGVFSFAFATYVQPKGSVTGFDIQPECIEYVQDKLRERPVEGVKFIQSTPSNIPAKDGSMDAGVMILVAHEIPNPDIFYPEIVRVLKTGAKLAIVEWLPKETIKGPPVTERLASEILASQLEKLGLSVLKTEALNDNHYLLTAKK